MTCSAAHFATKRAITPMRNGGGTSYMNASRIKDAHRQTHLHLSFCYFMCDSVAVVISEANTKYLRPPPRCYSVSRLFSRE